MSDTAKTATSGTSAPMEKRVPSLKKLARRLSVLQWLTLAGAAMIVSTALLVSQAPWSHPFAYPQDGQSWWLESMEWNSVRGLPDIKGNIKAAAIAPSSFRVWIAGDAGLLAYSDDAGDCWTYFNYDLQGASFAPAGPLCGNRRQVSWMEVPQRVEAATFQQQGLPIQQDSPPSRQTRAPQTAPPQTTTAPTTAPTTTTPTTPAPTTAPTTTPPATPSQTKMVEVPSLLGLSVGGAEKTLLSVGLHLGKISQAFSVSEIGNVTSQAPIPGERLPYGAAVDLVIGANLNSAQMPQIPDFKIPQNPDEAGIRGKLVLSPAGKSLGNAPDPSPPDLVGFKFLGKAASILASDGRVFSSSDSGVHWTGKLSGSADVEAFKQFVASPTLGFIVGSFVEGVKSSGASQETGKNEADQWPLHVSSGEENAFPSAELVFTQMSGIAPEFQAQSVWFSSKDSGCVAGYDAVGAKIECTRNARKDWAAPDLHKLKDKLYDIAFAADGKTGWAVGENAAVLWTADGGGRWEPKTLTTALHMGAPSAVGDWWRWLPPWFYLTWMAGLLCAAIAPLARVEAIPEKFIQDYAASDRPLQRGDRDALDFTPLAKSLSAFVRNAATKPPLTISVDGPWGSGKSSLMNLMCADLREFGFRAVWFNAWHNQKEEHLLAALLQTVRLEAVPQIWDPSGIGFRIHLVWNRLRRYWFPVMLVVGLVVLLFLLDSWHHQTSGHYLLSDVPRFLPAALGGTGKDAGGLFARMNQWPLLGYLAGLIAIWPVVRKLLEAFGTNPAALLATISKGNRIADLDAQTSFRDKFAKEFRDVTQALGENRQLVVFIDDLDRCRPENVRDVLEAVNFLVSSGECFVVMGLERRSVGAAVGLSLKDIAKEMADEQNSQPPEQKWNQAAAKDATPSGECKYQVPRNDDKDGLAARQRYANQFLDKLINLEVPIPRLDPNKAGGLFYDKTLETDPNDKIVAALLDRRKRERRAERWTECADGAIRVALGLVMIAILVSAGYFGGVYILQRLKQAPSAAAPAEPKVLLAVKSGSVALQVVDTNSVVAPAANASNNGTANTTPKETPPPPASPLGPSVQRPEFHPGSNPRPDPGKLWWPELIAAAILFMIAYLTLRLTGKGASHDSKKFVDALNFWYPLVIERQRTPRAVKRWMNRVRYLATRELPSGELRSPKERFADWYAGWGKKKTTSADVKIAKREEKEKAEKIPEEFVVALAAIDEFDPKALGSAEILKALQDISAEAGLCTLGLEADKKIAAKRELHRQQENFTSWDQIGTYVPRFQQLWPKIIVR